MSLLTESQCDALDVVLVSPRNPLNIGAAKPAPRRARRIGIP